MVAVSQYLNCGLFMCVRNCDVRVLDRDKAVVMAVSAGHILRQLALRLSLRVLDKA